MRGNEETGEEGRAVAAALGHFCFAAVQRRLGRRLDVRRGRDVTALLTMDKKKPGEENTQRWRLMRYVQASGSGGGGGKEIEPHVTSRIGSSICSRRRTCSLASRANGRRADEQISGSRRLFVELCSTPPPASFSSCRSDFIDCDTTER